MPKNNRVLAAPISDERYQEMAAAQGRDVCQFCGIPVDQRIGRAITCSSRCRVAWHRWRMKWNTPLDDVPGRRQ